MMLSRSSSRGSGSTIWNYSKQLLITRRSHNIAQIPIPIPNLSFKSKKLLPGPGLRLPLINSNLYSTSTSTTSSSSSPRSADLDSNSELLVTTKDRICRITFNRPDKKNAFNFPMFQQFISAMHQGSDDENVTLIVVTGTGSHFTSGMDLGGFRGGRKPSAGDPANPEPTDKKPRSFGVKLALSSILSCKKPLIALVNGPALGFGVTMLGLFDSVYASDSATFHTQFTKFGLPPEFGSTITFPNIMGATKANHVLLFNNKITAHEAYNCGLVSQVFPASTFTTDTDRKLKDMAMLPVKSLIYSKELVRGREIELYESVSEAEQKCFDPALAREVVKKFQENKANK